MEMAEVVDDPGADFAVPTGRDRGPPRAFDDSRASVLEFVDVTQQQGAVVVTPLSAVID